MKTTNRRCCRSVLWATPVSRHLVREPWERVCYAHLHCHIRCGSVNTRCPVYQFLSCIYRDTSIRISPQKSKLVFNNLQFGPRVPTGLLKKIYKQIPPKNSIILKGSIQKYRSWIQKLNSGVVFFFVFRK